MKILCVGEMMVDLLVHPVPEIAFDNDADSVEAITFQSGGDANNNAIDLAKLGNEVYLITLVGRDILADNCLQIARAAGVCVDYVPRSADTDQTRSVILINEQGNRHFLQCPGTSAKFSLKDVDLTLLDRVDYLQIGGAFHLPQFDGEGSAKLLQLARSRGVTTCMDITKDRTGRWTAIDPCYPYLDYFLPSIEQASCIAGTDCEQEIADYFLFRGGGTVVIKMGARGCYCKNRERAFYCDCYEVPVAEITGAGDAFVAGFLTALGRGRSIENCVRFATATSAHVVQAFGATAGIPDYDTVCRFMENRPPLELRII